MPNDARRQPGPLVWLHGDESADQLRATLELEGVGPEEAARVRVNDRDAGGFVGRPMRVDVSALIRPGRNAIHVEPFAPATARIVTRPR